jgi:hypothetical protein
MARRSQHEKRQYETKHLEATGSVDIWTYFMALISG